MAAITLSSKSLQSAGIREFGPFNIPDGITQVELAIEHGGANMPGISWGIMGSMDGGTTWMPWGGAGTSGPQPGMSSKLKLRLPEGTGRKAKVSLWLSAPITFAVTLTTS